MVDPVTRIEGHLRIEAQVEGGKIVDAWSSGTMFRGIEIILRGRDPRDAWLFAQRICGVCTMVHAITSVRAVENALGITIPPLANVMRNIIYAMQHIQDHVIHFYHLHALDWVDITSALRADPAQTSALAQSISDWPLSSTDYFKGVQDRLKAFVSGGRLGIFANAYWGHPAYKLPPEANLMAVAHYLQALDLQKEIIKAHAILGAKNPNLQTFLVGGMARPVDPSSQNALNADQIQALRQQARMAREFVEKVYIPDLLAIAGYYKDPWASIGEGLGNFLAYGEFPKDPSGDPKSLLLPRGLILDRDLSKVHPVDQSKVAEYVSHSYYEYTKGDGVPLHPFEGETRPKYIGPKPPYRFLDTDGKYSWLKSPRYDDKPVEVGPLARMLVAYASGVKRVRELVDFVLGKLGAPPAALFSTLGRTAARGIEALYLAELLPGFIDELATLMKQGERRIHAGKLWDPSTWPREARGVGMSEAPRGALAHWVIIRDGTIANYQAVVPTTWNGSPRDAKGRRGAYEASLIGTPLADPDRPVEILRTIHSFDPCLACSVHITDAESGRELFRVDVA